MESKTHKKDYFHILKIPFESIKSFTSNQFIVITGLVIISLFFLFYSISCYKKEKSIILEEIKKQFEISFTQYPEIYHKNLPIEIGTIERPKSDSITIATEQGTRKIYNEKERLSWGDLITHGLYTILYSIDSLDIKNINSLLQENLKSENLFIETVISISDHDNGIEKHSNVLDNSFKPLLPFKLEVGIANEMAFQCFIKLPFNTIIKRIQFRDFIFMGLFLVLISLYYIYKLSFISKKEPQSVTDLQQIAITIPNSQSRLLFSAFLASPNHQLTNKEISLCLWGYEKYVDGGIRTPISRLRKELKDYPFLSIKNIHGTGYELIIIP